MLNSRKKTISNVEKVIDGKGSLISKRSLDQSVNKISSKEHRVSALASRKPEQRCIVFTLVNIGIDLPVKFLVPFFLSVQGTGQSNHLRPGACLDVDSLESLFPQTDFICHAHLPKEQKLSEKMLSEESLPSRSSRPNASGQAHKRNKRIKSVKNSPCTSPNHFVSDNLPDVVGNGSSAACSDVLVTDIAKVNKPVKKKSKKKGKRKGKHCKGSMQQNVLADIRPHCPEVTSGSSVSETSHDNGLNSSNEHILAAKLSKNSLPASLLVEDIVMERVATEENSPGYINNTMSVMAGRSCSIEMGESEATSSQVLAEQEISYNQSNTSKCTIFSASNEARSPENFLPNHDESTSNKHIKRNNSYSVMSAHFVDQHLASTTDVILDDWNHGFSKICTDNSENQIKHESSFNNSAGAVVTVSNVDSSQVSGQRFIDIFDCHSSSERAQNDSQVCNSNDFLPVISGRRGRLAKKLAVNFNTVSRFIDAKSHGWTGKYSNHCVWQKVEKNDSCVTPCLEGIAPKKYLRRMPSVADSTDVGKGKPCSAPKQGGHSSRKGSHASSTRMERFSRTCAQQIAKSDGQNHVNHEKLIGADLSSPRATEVERTLANACNKGDDCQSDALQNSWIDLEEAKPEENESGLVCDSISAYESNQMVDSSDAEIRKPQLLTTAYTSDDSQCECRSDSSSNVIMGDMHDQHCIVFCSGQEKCMEYETGCYDAGYGKPDSIPRARYQKWIPGGRKDPVTIKCKSENCLIASTLSNLNPMQSNLKNEVELLGLKPDPGSTLATGCLQCLNYLNKYPECPLLDADELNCKERCQPDVDGDGAKLRLTQKVQGGCISEKNTDLEMIIGAIRDAHNLQNASESFQLIYGSSIAEFERFLHFTAPAIGQIDCIRSCRVCSQEQVPCQVLCPHQTPCMSLGNIWHWYEKPGSYGLEVNVGDYNNLKRLRNGHCGFCAYFVPYLSAVQLFGCSGCSSSSSNGNPTEKEIHEVDKSKDSLCSGRGIQFCHEELIFEYFESEPPQQRRPLFEKIKELVRGGTSSNCQMFGDPSSLKCWNLHDLHPASWYSVAWYPIYRIPDGNFRAAFLTYHSLGHFAYRKAASCSVASVVSPVVGLQSYNAKGECWFQPRGPVPQGDQNDGAETLVPSKLVRERLGALEHTAARMARAYVWKGGQKSLNRQPDYEFFLSRMR